MADCLLLDNQSAIFWPALSCVLVFEVESILVL